MHASHTLSIGHRRLLGTAAALVLAACSSASEPDVIRDPPTSAIDVRGTVVANDPGFPNDAITIDSARVVGDTLSAFVSHGGGCSNHGYQLVIGTAWMESFPVQVGGRIAHNANGDMCRALLKRNIRMNLLPLANAYRSSYQQTHGSVLIQLSGATKTLLYVF